MLRVKEVTDLLFDWGKDWRKGSEPSRVTKLFHAMVDQRPANELYGFIIKDITAPSVSSGWLGPIQIGAIIASAIVIYPPNSFGSDMCEIMFLNGINEALNKTDTKQPVEFQHGCIIGIFKAITVLETLGDSKPCLEQWCWPLAIKAAEKADLQSNTSCVSDFKGHFSNILGEYLATNKGVHWENMEKALIKLNRSLKKRKKTILSHPANGALRFLANEMAHKIFGKRANDNDRVLMVYNYLNQKKT